MVFIWQDLQFKITQQSMCSFFCSRQKTLSTCFLLDHWAFPTQWEETCNTLLISLKSIILVYKIQMNLINICDAVSFPCVIKCKDQCHHCPLLIWLCLLHITVVFPFHKINPYLIIHQFTAHTFSETGWKNKFNSFQIVGRAMNQQPTELMMALTREPDWSV